MAKKKQMPVPQAIAVTIEGKDYSGSYYVESGVLTVSYGFKSTSTHSSGTDAMIARVILRELVEAEKQE